MAIFRRNNYNTKREVEQAGGLAVLLRSFGGIGGANARVEKEHVKQIERTAQDGVPSLLARIYAPTTLDIAPLPFEASNVSPRASMIERIYERAKPDTSK